MSGRAAQEVSGFGRGKPEATKGKKTQEKKLTLIPVVPAPLYHLARVRLIRFNRVSTVVPQQKQEKGDSCRLASSFSTAASCVNRTSSCTSKLNIGPDLPRYLFTIKSSVQGEGKRCGVSYSKPVPSKKQVKTGQVRLTKSVVLFDGSRQVNRRLHAVLDGEGKERVTHVRDDQILLDVHEVVDRDGTQFRELLSTFFEELRDRVALLALPGWRTRKIKGFSRIRLRSAGRQAGGFGAANRTDRDLFAVPTPVPVRVGDLDRFLLHVLLHLEPLFPQLVALAALGLFAFAVGQEVRVDGRVLAKFGALGGAGCTSPCSERK